MMNDVIKIFEKPLPSTRSGAFFNAFSYPTKISPESIAVYIASMTKPGDVVLDTFGGSGSTGIAALLCEKPTDRMLSLSQELGLSPEWGARNAIGYEIGTYGWFAAKTITNRLKEKEFKKAVNDFVKKAEEKLGKYYRATDPDGKEGYIRHVIWSEILICGNCKKEVSYFDAGVERNPVKFNKLVKCPNCGKESIIDEMDYAIEDYSDPILRKMCKRKKRIPAWIYGSTDGKNWDRAAEQEDMQLVEDIDIDSSSIIPKKIKWGELHRNGYHFGIEYLHQFYTKRNFMIMHQLWEMTNDYADSVKDALRLMLLSYNASHCTLMTRVVAKKASKDFVLTGAQSGVLYISKLPVEKNILLGLARKAKPLAEAYRLLQDCTGSFEVRNQSSQHLVDEDGSIDMIFTDPPFGDFIPYAEVNQINELWLDKVTNRVDEIIISESQNKTLDDYKIMLKDVFSEIHRVMKTDASAVVVFHAAKAEVWQAFENVISSSSLEVQQANILDKEQASFKQIVSCDSVQGDPILLLKKTSINRANLDDNMDIIFKILEEHIPDTEFDERRIYSLYVNECLKKGIKISYDAKDAYIVIRNFRRDYTVNGAVNG
ncbi:MAG: site-specific DNA-methyltransferase [Lachnospiraceae bacterium]|nr:site-specific DNA-methyltransferase [Lachnospiraceae bacterium]